MKYCIPIHCKLLYCTYIIELIKLKKSIMTLKDDKYA